MVANHIKCEINHQAGTRHKQAGPPEGGSKREAPLSSAERGIELPNLKQPDCIVITRRYNREAHIAPGLALALRPLDEALEPLDGRRRRRNESRHFLGGEKR